MYHGFIHAQEGAHPSIYIEIRLLTHFLCARGFHFSESHIQAHNWVLVNKPNKNSSFFHIGQHIFLEKPLFTNMFILYRWIISFLYHLFHKIKNI